MIVYLDLDGVLVNFNKAACELVDAPYPPSKWEWYKDIPNGFKRINDKCGINFWANLEWMHDGHDILRTVTYYFNPDDIYLLTTPMPNLQSAWGKAEWVNRHLPEYNERLIIARAPKTLMAGPGTLLIDDKDENVEGFRQAGGQAILIARPWNKLDDRLWPPVQTLECDLKIILEKQCLRS